MKVESGAFGGLHDGRGRFWRVAVFYALVFLVTHALTLGYVAQGGSWRRLDSYWFANLIMLVPGLVAAGTARWLFREPARAVLGLSFKVNRWFFVAWLLPLALSVATLGLGLALPGQSYSRGLEGLSARFELAPSQLQQLVPSLFGLPLIYTLLVQGLLLGPTLSALIGLGEEVAYRGLLFRELTAFGFWRRSWIIGLLWGVWHVPLVFEGYGYPKHPLLGAFLLVVFTVLASPLYVFLRLRAGSVLAPAICHGSFSACMLLTFAPIAGGGELTSGLIAVPGIVVLAVSNLALFVLAPSGLAASSADPKEELRRAA